MGDHEFALQLAGCPNVSLSKLSLQFNSPASLVGLYDILNNNDAPSLFLPLSARQAMQDDLLMDKSKAQPRHQQDPTSVDPPSAPTPASEAAPPPPPPAASAESPSSRAAPPASDHQEKAPMESPILPGLSFHQPQETGGSLSPSFGGTWSTGTGTGNAGGAADDSFFQGIPSVNGTMLFQNFPHHHHHHHVNPVFGGNFSPQIGLAQSQHQQQQQQQQQAQQRRSPVSPNQGPFPQRNAYQAIMNSGGGGKGSPSPASSSSSSSSSSWNNHQNAAWSTASNPWSGMQAGRDPRRAVGVGVGVGVPSPLNPISPMKKPYSANVIAPPKYPRAGPLTPKSWMEDSAFRTDNGNNLLPFQCPHRQPTTFSVNTAHIYIAGRIVTSMRRLTCERALPVVGLLIKGPGMPGIQLYTCMRASGKQKSHEHLRRHPHLGRRLR
ncbi:Cytoplasmic polyadenylation element-binding protein 3 [Merluccius polli]|uniref:Cytoplasmic polyadenylation element-binding protein 3 n=1 Tax=Merluccius polli TaxID=89951 RepID=A0AA47NUG8_MERPO|nr:Cytoplasmic polyadenylation element-binding protein 3 [Merluccius polli]